MDGSSSLLPSPPLPLFFSSLLPPSLTLELIHLLLPLLLCFSISIGRPIRSIILFLFGSSNQSFEMEPRLSLTKLVGPMVDSAAHTIPEYM